MLISIPSQTERQEQEEKKEWPIFFYFFLEGRVTEIRSESNILVITSMLFDSLI